MVEEIREALESLCIGCSEATRVLLGGAIGALIAIGIIFAILIGIALYVYFAYAWMTIAKKLKHKNPWLAWIPFANFAMMLQLGGFHWAWVFTAFFPPALFVLLIIATWRIFERRNYPGWFSLAILIPKVGGILYLIAIGFVAWEDKGRGSSITQIKKRRKK